MAEGTDPCSASFFSKLFSGNAIVCNQTFKDSLVSSGQAEIQSVVDNAPDDYSAEVGQQSANAQKIALLSDVDTITEDVAKSATAGKTCDDGSPGINLSILGLPCIKYAWIKWGAVGLVALVALYVLALVSSIIPRRG